MQPEHPFPDAMRPSNTEKTAERPAMVMVFSGGGPRTVVLPMDAEAIELRDELAKDAALSLSADPAHRASRHRVVVRQNGGRLAVTDLSHGERAAVDGEMLPFGG